MQEQMQKAQEELKNETVQATAGGGMVTVTATGGGEIKEIKIDPKAIDPDDPEMLEDMVLAAVNEALRSAQEPDRVEARPRARRLARHGAPGALVADGRVEGLRRISLFADLGTASSSGSPKRPTRSRCPPGSFSSSLGGQGTGMFFICDGTVVVETKREQIELGPGNSSASSR